MTTRPIADRFTLIFYDHRCNGRSAAFLLHPAAPGRRGTRTPRDAESAAPRHQTPSRRSRVAVASHARASQARELSVWLSERSSFRLQRDRKVVYRQVSQEVCPWNVCFAKALPDDSPLAARAAPAGNDARTLAGDLLDMTQLERQIART